LGAEIRELVVSESGNLLVARLANNLVKVIKLSNFETLTEIQGFTHKPHQKIAETTTGDIVFYSEDTSSI